MNNKLNQLLVVLLILLAATWLLADQIEVTEFRVLHSDFKAEAEPVQDLDGNYCAVIRVDGDIPSGLSLAEKVYKKEETDGGEIYFYISAKEAQITLESLASDPLTLNVPDNGFMVGKVYYLRIKSVAEEGPAQLPVLIATKPEDAKILLNGEDVGFSNKTVKLEPGTYELLLGKPGYEIVADLIEVKSDQKNVFSYALQAKNKGTTAGTPPEEQTPPGGDVVIFDDFEDGNMDNWIRLSGEWGEAGGALNQISDERGAFILTGNEKIENYMIEVDAKKSSGKAGFFIVLGSKLDNKRAIVWSVGGWYNKTSVLMSYTNLARNHQQEIKSTESQFTVEDNKWYKVKVIIEGAHVRAYINNNLIIDYSDPEIAVLTTGRIGLGSYVTKVSFDNLKVTRLP